MANNVITLPNGALVAPDHKKVILNVKLQSVYDRVKKAMPYVEEKAYDGGILMAMPMHEDTCKILHNEGFGFAGLEPFRYSEFPLIEGKYPAMPHQVDTAAFLTVHKRAFCTNEMRTGKTGATIIGADYALKQHMNGATLVVCTKSNMYDVWYDAIRETTNAKISVLHGGNNTGKAVRVAALNIPADYYLINYDGVKMIEKELLAAVKSGKIRCVILDELTHYGKTTSARWKAMDRVINDKDHPVEYVWGLTGSPGSVLNVFGYVKMVTPWRMPFKRLSQWQEHVQYKYGSQTWMWKDREDAAERVNKIMQPTIRFSKKDVLPFLPPVSYVKKSCDLTKDQKDTYEKLKRDGIMMTKAGNKIIADQKSALVGKLLQIAGGAVIADEGTVVRLDLEERITAMLEVIEGGDAKTVIFAPYTGVINKLVEEFNNRKDPRTGKNFVAVKIDGSVTSITKRRDILKAFREEEHPDILVCHPATMAFGADLATADTIIFSGPPMSGSFIYEQARERLSSVKQKADAIRIVELSATPEERHIFTALNNKMDLSAAINELFKEDTERLLDTAA